MRLNQNLRLILMLFVAAGAGIIVILGMWLYGSYHQRIDLFLATAERTMFDAIQETVQARPIPASGVERSVHTDDSGFAGGFQRGGRFQGDLVAEILRAYPEIDKDSLSALITRLRVRRADHFPAPAMPFVAGKDPGARPRQLLPHFLFDQAVFDSQSLASVERAFAEGLEALGLKADFTVAVLTIGPRSEGIHPDSARSLMDSQRSQLDSATANKLAIRPVLIDPGQGRFITASFHHPWQYLLYSLSWQLVISVILVATLIGCFIYLFHTVFRQNELAQLRKAFINNITHELRTPVATVSAAVQALQRYSAAEDRERRDKYLAISKEELDHLSAMIDSVLQVAEGDRVSIKQLNLQPVDLTGIIRRCVEKARVHHQQKSVDFFMDRSTPALTIRADGEHLRNVVSNLLDNAAKYGATEVRVSLQAEATSKFVVLRVQDNGVGIPLAYRERVFEPFFRVPEGDLHHVKGNGLGLSYVKQVVTQHKGTVKVESQPGEGTLFSLTIPKSVTHD